MVKNILIWVLAFVVTAAVAIYQRVTGPTYPIKSIELHKNAEIEYKFLRSEDVDTDLKVLISSEDTSLSPVTFWKRYKTYDDWVEVVMRKDSAGYYCYLPSQPPAGKLEYFVQIDETLKLPKDENVVIRYKGSVPTVVLIFHVIAMFGAMLLSTRTGMEFFRNEPNLKSLTYWTLGFLIIGGFILGPIVQKYAFDAYWTGWPFGHDLTDNKTAVAIAGWLIALYMYNRSANPKRWALFASLLLLIIYLIPHSVLGSELDYSKLENNDPNTTINKQLPEKIE